MLPIDYIIYLLVLVSLSVYCAIVFKKLPQTYKLMTALIWITLLTEIVGRIVGYYIQNSSIVYHFYAPIQLIVIGCIYYLITRKKIIIICIAVLFILNILNSSFLQNPLVFFPSNSLMINSVFIILGSLYVLYYFTGQFSQDNNYRAGSFWFIAANLLFFPSTIAYFSFLNYMSKITEMSEKEMEMFEIASLLLSFTSIISYILYFFSLYNTVKKLTLNTENA